MNRAVIAAYARSPFTPAKKGELASVRPDDLAAQVIAALVKNSKVNPADLEDLLLGCAFPEGEQGLNVARMISFIAGLPISLGAATINRYCGSSMTSVHVAAGAIAMGAGDAFICAGVESMTRVPMMGFNPMPNPDLVKTNPAAYMPMGDTAENVAARWKISRLEQEQFAVESQRRAAAARAAGKFKDEIIAITTKKGVLASEDGCIRADTTLEGLAGLKPAFS
ncbi:MAG TPA: acetyl-CoA C-acyltransferase, partial [Aestuariivirga sp.]